MRILLLASALVLAMAPMTARAQEPAPPAMDRGTYDTQLRDLQFRSEQLASDIGRSRRALGLIAMNVFEEHGGARLRVAQENRMGPFYRLTGATYAIDGTAVYHQVDAGGALGEPDQLGIYDGAITPGEHVLTVRLEYTGQGGEVVDYLEGYRFVVTSSHHFTAADGRLLRVQVVAYERDTMRAFTDRPWVGYRESLTVE